MKLTDDAGYLLIINTRTNHFLLPWMYRTEKAIGEYLKNCFGSLPPWQRIPEREITLNGERAIE